MSIYKTPFVFLTLQFTFLNPDQCLWFSFKYNFFTIYNNANSTIYIDLTEHDQA